MAQEKSEPKQKTPKIKSYKKATFYSRGCWPFVLGRSFDPDIRGHREWVAASYVTSCFRIKLWKFRLFHRNITRRSRSRASSPLLPCNYTFIGMVRCISGQFLRRGNYVRRMSMYLDHGQARIMARFVYGFKFVLLHPRFTRLSFFCLEIKHNCQLAC